MNSSALKVFGFIFSFLLLLNMILFALRKISGLLFWSVILIGAVAAYVVVPKVGKNSVV